MGWESELARGGSEPEMQLWRILDDMGLKFLRNVPMTTPFRDYPVEADVLVEGVLVIEVQSEYFHSKSTRHRKDVSKFECFTAMGLGCLWLYDDELKYAFQKERGKVWRGAIEDWIRTMLQYSKLLNARYFEFKQQAVNAPNGKHPDFGVVNLMADSRRL